VRYLYSSPAYPGIVLMMAMYGISLYSVLPRSIMLREIAKKKIKTIKKMMNTPKSRNTCFNMVTKKDS